MLIYKQETPSLESIRDFFYRTNDEFDIPLNQKVDIYEYTLKLYTYADFFVCYDNDKIVGMICCYMNRPPHSYISHVCVDSEYQGIGVFKCLYSHIEEYCIQNKIFYISLEVSKSNTIAKFIYYKMGFIVIEEKDVSFIMQKKIENKYNVEFNKMLIS